MQANVIIDTTGGTIESEFVSTIGWKPTKKKLKTVEIAGYELPLYEICKLDSTNIDDRIRNEKIGPTIARQVDEGYHVVLPQRSIVLYHGTDTLADTAGVLDYNLYGNNRRIVITGALYPPEFPKSDVEMNKQDSVIFAMNGYGRSGVVVVMGGNVLSPFFWSKHYWRPHDPVIELLRLSDSKGVLEKLDVELHEPFDPIAKIKEGKILPGYPSRPKYDETTYLSADDYFSISEGGEGKVRHLDMRGSAPYSGKIPEINNILNEYGKFKEMAFNYSEKRDEALSRVEDLLRNLNLDPNIFTIYWKNLKPCFDPRTNLEQVLVVGDQSSDPLGYVHGIKDGTWPGVVIRAVGYGHIKIKPKWEKVLKIARENSIPVVIVTDEGVITSNEYAVAKPLPKLGVNYSGTLNAKESQIRVATGIGDEKKRKFIKEVAAEIFDSDLLSIFSAFYVPGMLFKDAEQRNEWVHTHGYSTNIDVAVSPLFTWEEKILLSGLNYAYVSGKLERL